MDWLQFWPEILTAVLTVVIIFSAILIAWKAGEPPAPPPPSGNQIRGMWE
jgi:hypothetical protein